MKLHSYEIFEINEEKLFSQHFIVSYRYEITVNVNAKNLYKFSKENNFSFFNSCVAAIYKAVEYVPELKKYIINGEGRQYSETNIVFFILNDDHTTQDVCVDSISSFNSFKEWNDFLNNVKANPEDYLMVYDEKTIEMPFTILSVMPWFTYTGFRNLIFESDIYTPVIHWGKYENGNMSLTLSVNHNFVYAYHCGLFFNKLNEYFENPELIFPGD